MSVIRDRNQSPYAGLTSKSHSYAEYMDFRGDFNIKIDDGKIQVYNDDFPEFMVLEDDRIVKSELQFLLISGWDSYQNWRITPYEIAAIGKF